MILNIKQYEYKKVETTSKQFVLPIEPVYYFETGIRRAIRIVPVLTKWKTEIGEPEVIYQLDITLVYNCYHTKIEKISIFVSDIEKIYYDTKLEHHNFIKSWVDGDFDIRTKERFEQDLTNCINIINK